MPNAGSRKNPSKKLFRVCKVSGFTHNAQNQAPRAANQFSAMRMHVLHMHVVILVCKSITPDQRIKAHLPKYDPLASQSAEEVSELSRLAQQQQWTEVQYAFLNASKACVIGRAIPFPTSNKGDPEAACQWDCWRRATMLEPLAWDVLHNGIAGDFIEAGVYKGGISVHMEALLHAFYSLRGTTTHAPRERVRQMWLADSFGGLPPSKAYNKQFAERDGGIRAGTDMESIAQAAKFEYAGARDWTPGKFASPLDAVKKRMLTCLSSTYSSRTHQPFPAMGTTESCGKSHIIIGPCMQVSTPPLPQVRQRAGKSTEASKRRGQRVTSFARSGSCLASLTRRSTRCRRAARSRSSARTRICSCRSMRRLTPSTLASQVCACSALCSP